MRWEVEHGLAGARELQTQLKEARRREEELRATNALLTAKSAEAMFANKKNSISNGGASAREVRARSCRVWNFVLIDWEERQQMPVGNEGILFVVEGSMRILFVCTYGAPL